MSEIGNNFDKEPEKFNRFKDMAAWDHVAIGSTVMVNGELFGGNEFADALKQNKDLHDAKVPQSVKKGTDIALVSQRRDGQIIEGALGILKPEEQVAVMSKNPGILPAYILGPLDPENGEVKEEFRIGLVNEQKELVLPELLDTLSLAPDIADLFESERVGKYLRITRK